MTKRLTRTAIAKACVAAGLPADIELVKGNGYFYFWGHDVALWPSSSVYVFSLNDLTLDQWVNEAVELQKRHIRYL